MCHRDRRDKFEDNDSSLEDFIDPIENEANTFASWLLIPANLLSTNLLKVRGEFLNFVILGCVLNDLSKLARCGMSR